MDNKIQNNNWLLMVSLDLCNSTEIKSHFENKSDEYKSVLYDEYLTKIHNIEFSFYRELFYSYYSILNLNISFDGHYKNGFIDFCKLKKEDNLLESLFVLKNIGDEIWFSIEIPKNDIKKLINTFIALYDASFTLRCDSIQVYESKPPELNVKIDEDSLSRKERKIDLNFKIYCDLIDDAVDIQPNRLKLFDKNINSLCITPRGPFRIPFAQQNRLMENLNVAYLMDANSHKALIKQRSDFISYQIDRFFRYKSNAKFDCLTVGSNLFKHLYKKETFTKDLVLCAGKSVGGSTIIMTIK